MTDTQVPVPFKEKFALAMLRLSAMLPLPVSRGLGALFGLTAFLLRTEQYRVTLQNLQISFPELGNAERRRLARVSMMETGKLALETGAVWLRDLSWTESRIKGVYNEHLLDEALASGQGLIILAPHLGNWEVLGLYVETRVHVTSLYQPPNMPSFEAVIRDAREKNGATLVPTNNRGVAALIKALRSGGVSGILPDQVPAPSGGDFAPFFGRPALTMTLVHNLQQRSGCRIMAGFAQRVPGGFEIHFQPADDEIYSGDSAQALAALNRTVENCVRLVPEQYQWEYKRYRKFPKGMSNPYKKQ
ncbi:lysophospholipid acyltransferase family protein [Pseudomaricurvus sp. HS19]|uniref:lysophospholipid acyltransferase family protein n=1 Tax=Pseudomaricurvus sp. HS19 TaxID=2692626 RepID=UPI00136BFF6B|nr:lysophospholipid acyltransferase family protein [Pseudomaricurvus sp. HS19]MYM63753.1 lipid A biosynthesis lauroyl acyltransferase [Pseudomaricurvus sp. HS19]